MTLLLRLLLPSLIVTLSACGGGGSDSNDEPLPPAEPTHSDALDLSPVTKADSPSPLPANWQRDGVFMEIFVRSYADSDGDGYGDFNGLTSKLDYLQDLGITGIWLMPINPSQDNDHNYAVTDYRAIHPHYGSLDDFRTFLDEAHERGIGVIMDYVINHSAATNPLFLDSRENLGGKRSWYSWSDTPPAWVQPWSPETPAWRLDAVSGSSYLAVFDPIMPDFDLTNPSVVDFHHNNLRFWLNLGLDGFRFDAVSHMFDANGALEGDPRNYPFLNQLRQTINSYPNRYTVCESSEFVVETAASNACGSAFAFYLQWGITDSVIRGSVNSYLDWWLASDFSHMATLLSNHDGFAGDRPYSQFGGNLAQYRLASATLLTLPGIPFIYYGEEIGMGRNSQGADYGLRAPMSWDDSATAGFTTGTPYRALASNKESHNVADQLEDPDSLLNFYKTLIALRKAEPALHQGSMTRVASSRNSVLSFRRSHGDDEILVILNYGGSQSTNLTPAMDGDWQALYPTDAPVLTTSSSDLLAITPAAQSVAIYKKL
ncbi:MAG: DUF3459 domain-containing protein [Gammaproteobacteria bacterium]|nr:DUF3459 domain-containing protein [Gammaproteobacteria bacterium]